MHEMQHKTRRVSKRPLSNMSIVRVPSRPPLFLGWQLHRIHEPQKIRSLSRATPRFMRLFIQYHLTTAPFASLQAKRVLVRARWVDTRQRVLLMSIRRVLFEFRSICAVPPLYSASSHHRLLGDASCSTGLFHQPRTYPESTV